jgi:hypothetical protein
MLTSAQVTEGGYIQLVDWALIGNRQAGVEWQGHVLPLGYSRVQDCTIVSNPRWINATAFPQSSMGVWTGARG